MLDLLLIWFALFAALVLFVVGRPGKGAALTLAYFLSLSLIHVPGVLPYLGYGVLPDPSVEGTLADPELTRLGFQMTVLGMAAFVVGALLAGGSVGGPVAGYRVPARRRARLFEALGWRTFQLGILSYFVIMPLSRLVPSLTSLVSSLATLLIIGFWLVLYGALVAGDRRRTLITLGLLPLLPVATLVTGGFLGYGVNWVLSVIAFQFVITRRRALFYLAAPFAVFLGLSLFVTYMGQRNGIREVVWYEQSGIFDRLDRISAIVTKFQLLDLNSSAQVDAIDGRLNQNSLVGAAIDYHANGGPDFAYGGTIPPWSLIPRAIWPNKPDTGGGGDVVSRYTGLLFAGGTSVGAGQVLEFYVNFGVPGVLAGFFGLGFLLRRLDRDIMRALVDDDMRGLLLRAMPGLMMLSPGGNLLEIIVGSVAAYVAARAIISLKFFDIPQPMRAHRRLAT